MLARTYSQEVLLSRPVDLCNAISNLQGRQKLKVDIVAVVMTAAAQVYGLRMSVATPKQA